jgi:hypothetical protein
VLLELAIVPTYSAYFEAAGWLIEGPDGPVLFGAVFC